MGSKRGIFQAVEELESQDKSIALKRRKVRSDDVAQSKACQSQQAIYHSLLECRILLQRAIQAEREDKEKGIDLCNDLISHFVTARTKLLQQSPLKENNTSFDEETLEQEFQSCQESWKNVLNKRQQDVRLHSGQSSKSQFRVVDTSFWQQIEATVQYEEARDQEFNDQKVYQQLLKDFVLSKSTTNDPSAKTAATKPVQNKKKQVDRKASKGRKIRYHVIPKLVNFTFPVSRPQSALDPDAWFKSLFGGVAYHNDKK